MNAAVPAQRPSLIAKVASRYGVEPDKFLATLKATILPVKDGPPASNEELMAFLIVADQYQLNPFTRQIIAFRDKRGGIIPVVPLDGWARLLNRHPQYDGLDFEEGPDDERGQTTIPTWTKCIIFRKDRGHPIAIKERFSEVRRDTAPWKSHPFRMLRHKALIQCARVALGFSGIYDEDEAQRIAAGEAVLVNLPPQASRTEQAKALLGKEPEATEAAVPPPDEEEELPISDERAQPPWPTE